MKKILALITVSILPLMFTACGQKTGTESYIGYWQSDANTIFEVLTENGEDYNGKCFISYSACYDDARAVADIIEESFPKLNGKVQLYSIGTVIGSHTGPGTVALFFWGKERDN